MNELERALNYVNQDIVHYANLAEVLRRGSAQIRYVGEDGLLLYDRVLNAPMLSAKTMEQAEAFLALIDPGADLLVGHEPFYRELLARRLDLEGGEICYSCLYPKKTPLPIPAFEGELRLLTQEYAPYVERHYSNSFGGMAYIEKVIGRGMLGLFVGETLAGFIGFHDEGTMGLLEVLPQFRRRGFGEILERGAINLALARGQYPFGQVFKGNEASFALQRKLGLAVSEREMFWIYS